MADSQHPSFIHPGPLWRELGLRAGQTVIHLGCGPGFYLIPAAKMVGATGKAIGLDIRSDILAEVESRATREGVGDIVDTARVDLEAGTHPAVKAASADWVLVANILHQAEPRAILAEAARLVKPQGTVVVIEWEVVATPLGPPPAARPSPTQVTQVAQEVGLTATGTFDPSQYHYGLLFAPQKK